MGGIRWWVGGSVLGLGFAVLGYVLGVANAPEPIVETRTEVHDVLPACGEIEAAVQAERALAEQLAASDVEVQEASAELAEVALSADKDAIVEQGEVLDAALRAEQQLTLDLATAQATTDATVGDCAPEREQ